jgi:hypothetical protein
MEVMDECLLRRARAGRGWALEEVMVTASACDSMTSGRGTPSIVRGGRGDFYGLAGRTERRCEMLGSPGATRSSRTELGNVRAPRYVRTDEPSQGAALPKERRGGARCSAWQLRNGQRYVHGEWRTTERCFASNGNCGEDDNWRASLSENCFSVIKRGRGTKLGSTISVRSVLGIPLKFRNS